MRFSGVTLALILSVKPKLVSPVALDKIDRSVQSLSNIITSGAGDGASD